MVPWWSRNKKRREGRRYAPALLVCGSTARVVYVHVWNRASPRYGEHTSCTLKTHYRRPHTLATAGLFTASATATQRDATLHAHRIGRFAWSRTSTCICIHGGRNALLPNSDCTYMHNAQVLRLLTAIDRHHYLSQSA